MTHHYARLIAVAIAAVSFSTPITAQQEPTPSPTWETLLETVGGTGIHERSVWLFDVTDTDLALLAPFTEWGALEELNLSDSEVIDVGLAHLTGLPALKNLGLGGTQVTAACIAPGFLDSDLKGIIFTQPRPGRRSRVALEPGCDRRTSPASTARCTSA